LGGRATTELKAGSCEVPVGSNTQDPVFLPDGFPKRTDPSAGYVASS
jgi:hypothetical protein